MLVSKDGEVVQCGSGKSHWPFRGWMEATGCCGTLRCQSEYHILLLRYRDTHDMKDSTDRQRSGKPRNLHVHVSPQTVDRSIRLAILRNRHITARRLQMRYLGRHDRRVSVQTIRNRLHASQFKSRKAAQKPLLTAGVTIEFIDDQSCCERWLTIGTERFWQISSGPHLSSPSHIFCCDHDIGTQ